MSNTPLTMRSARASDWPHIAALLQSHRLPLDGAREHLAQFCLAVCGDNIVGCAGMEVYGHEALLRSVAVQPDQQGIGVGQRLVSHLMAAAKHQHVTALYLLTTSAADYFARLGFQRLSAQQAPAALKQSLEFQGACPSSAVLMRLTLST